MDPRRDALRETVRQAAEAAAAAEGGPSPEGVMTLRAVDADSVTVSTHRATLSPAGHRAAREAFVAGLAGWGGDPSGVQVTLRLDSGERPAGADELTCRPVMRNRSAAGAQMQEWAERNAARAPARSRRYQALVRVLVTRDGETVFAELEQASGWPAFDNALLHLARRIRAEPGRRGEQTVDAWIVLPVRVTVPEGPAPRPLPSQERFP